MRKAGRRGPVTLLRPKAPRMAERVVEDVLAAFASLWQPTSRAYYDKKRREGQPHVAVGGTCRMKRQFRMLLTWARSSVVRFGGRADHLRRTARGDHREWNQRQPASRPSVGTRLDPCPEQAVQPWA